jgi:hypothetical protein
MSAPDAVSQSQIDGMADTVMSDRTRMTPEELRYELAMFEWSLHQWEVGNIAKLENGAPITSSHVATWRREIEELKRLLTATEGTAPTP